MNSIKCVRQAYSLIEEMCDSLGIEITSNMGYADVFRSIVEGLKLRIELLQMKTVDKIINFIEQEEALKIWEKDILATLYKRKSVGYHV